MNEEKEWLIRKSGYYYRPNRAGYTASPLEAGRYTEKEARAEASVEPWQMRAIHIDEVMDRSGHTPVDYAEQLYAVADKVSMDRASLIMAGKPYKVYDFKDVGLTSFWIINEAGLDAHCLKESCPHLGNKNDWRIVPESDLTDHERKLIEKIRKPEPTSLANPPGPWDLEERITALEESRKTTDQIDKSLFDNITAKITGKFDKRFKDLEDASNRHENSLEFQSKQDNILFEELEKLDMQYEVLKEGHNGLSADQKQMYKEFNQRLGLMAKRLNDLEKMRPHWAQGYTSDGVAAQVKASALNQLWSMLGTNNQTEAVEKLKALNEKAQPGSDGWILHDGGECPVSGGVLVDVHLKNGSEAFSRAAGSCNWSDTNGPWNITHYRPVKQRKEPTVHIEETARQQGKSWAYNMYMQAQQEAEWPQEGNTYWCIDAALDADWSVWRGDWVDTGHRDGLGIYPTRAQAEEAARKIKRVMEHWRNGRHIILAENAYVTAGEKVKL